MMAAEPVALAFANTRSSSRRDRIADYAQWRAWSDARPGLQAAGRAVDADGLSTLRTVRDDIQAVLRASAHGRRPDGEDEEAAERLLALARAPAAVALDWHEGRCALAVPRNVAPATVIGRHLAHATVNLLVSGPSLAACQGDDCLKVFVTSRADRRWCDSTVCGNRARVRAYSRRWAGDQ